MLLIHNFVPANDTLLWDVFDLKITAIVVIMVHSFGIMQVWMSTSLLEL